MRHSTHDFNYPRRQTDPATLEVRDFVYDELTSDGVNNITTGMFGMPVVQVGILEDYLKTIEQAGERVYSDEQILAGCGLALAIRTKALL